MIKKIYLIFFLIILSSSVIAVNSTLYLSGAVYNNTRIFDYNVSIYNTTTLVSTNAVNSTLTSLGTSSSTTSSSFVSVLFSNLSNGSTPQYTYLDYNYNAASNGELRANITYANGTSALTETDAVSGASGGSFINNVSVTTPIVSIDWQARSPGGVTTVQYTGLSNVYVPGIINVSLQTGNYTVVSNTSGYAVTSTNYTFSSSYEERTFVFYTTNSINFAFFDEVSGNLINSTTVYAYVTSSIYSRNFSTTNGTYYIDLLTPANYTITYYASNYNSRNYFYTLNNASTTALNLYLANTNTSTVLLIQVRDSSLKPLSGAYVYQMIKNLSGTNDYISEMCLTDFNGRCQMSADVSTSSYKATTTYRYYVIYGGVTVGDSGYTLVSTTADAACESALPCLQLVASLGSSSLSTYFQIPYISFSLENTSQNNFELTVFDEYANIQNSCLYIYRYTGVSKTLMNSSCSSGTSSTINLFSNTSLGDSTTAEAYVVINGEYILLDTDTISNNDLGTQGNASFIVILFLGVILTVLFAFKGKASLALFSAAAATMILSLISSLPLISKGFITAFCLILIFVAVRLKE